MGSKENYLVNTSTLVAYQGKLVSLPPARSPHGMTFDNVSTVLVVNVGDMSATCSHERHVLVISGRHANSAKNDHEIVCVVSKFGVVVCTTSEAVDLAKTRWSRHLSWEIHNMPFNPKKAWENIKRLAGG